MQFSYPVTLTKDKHNEGYVVTFVDFPEAITQGKNIEDALKNAVDCLEEAIANHIAMKLTIPTPSKKNKRHPLVQVPSTMATKAALYLATRESGLTNVTLARRLNCDEKEIRRLLDPYHPSKLSRIEKILNKLGKHLIIGVTV
jgi:antitoxin HicB